MSPSCDVRKESFNNFSKYVQLFCRKGRLRLSKMILNGANHSGMIGYAISIFKDAIVEGNEKDKNWVAFYATREKVHYFE